MDNIEIWMGLLFGVIIFVVVITQLIPTKKNAWVSTEEFQRQKLKMKPFCSEEEFFSFMKFLKTYQGGYIRRRSGRIVSQEYLGKEKGDLKGIYFNIIVPNPNLTSAQKEEFRTFLLSVGVNGVEFRPSYETRDSRLKNRKTDEQEYLRKEVGNKGEQAVREVLEELDNSVYDVINGPVLRYQENVKEYDHIVIGKNGVFLIETKAFGMSSGNPSKAALFIDDGDKWILRKNKVNRELVSPTQQIFAEKEQLEHIIDDGFIVVHPILVLSNTELFVKQNIDLPYDVVRVDELNKFIYSYKDSLVEMDLLSILQKIDNSRIN